MQANWHMLNPDFHVGILKIVPKSNIEVVRAFSEIPLSPFDDRAKEIWLEFCYVSDNFHIHDPHRLFSGIAQSLFVFSSGVPRHFDLFGCKAQIYASNFEQGLDDLESPSYPIRCCNVHGKKLVVKGHYKRRGHTLFNGKVKRECPESGCSVAWWGDYATDMPGRDRLGDPKNLPANSATRDARKSLFDLMKERAEVIGVEEVKRLILNRTGFDIEATGSLMIGTMSESEANLVKVILSDHQSYFNYGLGNGAAVRDDFARRVMEVGVLRENGEPAKGRRRMSLDD